MSAEGRQHHHHCRSSARGTCPCRCAPRGAEAQRPRPVTAVYVISSAGKHPTLGVLVCEVYTMEGGGPVPPPRHRRQLGREVNAQVCR